MLIAPVPGRQRFRSGVTSVSGRAAMGLTDAGLVEHCA